jgi:pimeloyl-ACP methyl ester carboxylesterase
MSNPNECHSCRRTFGIFFSPGYECPQGSGGCGKKFCSKCLNYACVTEKDGKELGMKAPVTSFCKGCFQQNSLLDFSTNVTIYGPEIHESPAVLFLHGGGGCRTMFDYHAKTLSEQKGYRCVLIDLPGHGSRMDEVLTLDSAMEVIKDAILHIAGNCGEIKPIAVGGSLGGYILMEFVGRYPDLLSGGIITMCGQNVGVDRSLLASVGLFALGYAASWVSSKTLLSGLISEASKSGHLNEELILTATLRAGVYFDQSEAQITILKQSNPRDSLPKFPGKLLFVNGTKDHRDSEGIWVSVSQNGQLIDYESGDHFFSHDNRFLNIFMNDIVKFCESLLESSH